MLAKGPEVLRPHVAAMLMMDPNQKAKHRLRVIDHLVAALEVGREANRDAKRRRKESEEKVLAETVESTESTEIPKPLNLYAKASYDDSDKIMTEFSFNMRGGGGINFVKNTSPGNPTWSVEEFKKINQTEIDSRLQSDKAFLTYKSWWLLRQDELLRNGIYAMLKDFIDPLLLAIIDFQKADFNSCCRSNAEFGDSAHYFDREKKARKQESESNARNSTEKSRQTLEKLEVLTEVGVFLPGNAKTYNQFNYILDIASVPEAPYKGVFEPRLKNGQKVQEDIMWYMSRSDEERVKLRDEDEQADLELANLRRAATDGKALDGCFGHHNAKVGSSLLHACCTFEMIHNSRRQREFGSGSFEPGGT